MRMGIAPNGIGVTGTFSAWVQKTDATAVDKDYVIFSIFTSATDRIYVEMETYASVGGSGDNIAGSFGAGGSEDRLAFGSALTLDTWAMISLTWVGGVPLSLYRDGVLEAVSFDNFSGQSDAAPAFGNYGTDSWSWGGIIDSPMLFRRAFSAGEINRLYNLTRHDHASWAQRRESILPYTPAAAPAATSTTAIFHIRHPVSPGTMARNASTAKYPFVWDGLEVAYSSQVAMGYHDLANRSGNQGISVGGGPAIAQSSKGTAWNFDGVDDVINIGQPDALNFASKDFTLSCWCNHYSSDPTESGLNYDYIINRGDGAAARTLTRRRIRHRYRRSRKNRPAPTR